MSDFSQTIIIGHAGKDAELIAYGNEGKEMCVFSVAVSEGRDKPSTWYSVACFGNTTEYGGKDVTKGSRVTVIGKMTSRKKEGKEYWSLLANRVVLDKGHSEPKQNDAWSDVGREKDDDGPDW